MDITAEVDRLFDDSSSLPRTGSPSRSSSRGASPPARRPSARRSTRPARAHRCRRPGFRRPAAALPERLHHRPLGQLPQHAARARPGAGRRPRRVGQDLAADETGLDPVVRFYRDADHQCEAARSGALKSWDECRLHRSPQVVVLFAAQRPGVRGGGVLAGWGAAPRTGDGAAVIQSWRDCCWSRRASPDMRSGKTKYASIYRFKGLESRAVVLTDIDRLETAHDRDLFYIGATRATHRLVGAGA